MGAQGWGRTLALGCEKRTGWRLSDPERDFSTPVVLERVTKKPEPPNLETQEVGISGSTQIAGADLGYKWHFQVGRGFLKISCWTQDTGVC